MKLFFVRFFVSVLILLSFLGFHFFAKTAGWQHYSTVNAQKEMQPDLIPSGKLIRLMSMGHELTYADFVWLSLIQYIGANIYSQNYLNFSTEVITSITEAHPHFAPAYEWALLLFPIPQNSNLEYSPEEKERLQKPLQLARNGMHTLCDYEKIFTIIKEPLSYALWNNEELKNPCPSGMLPYYIAFYGGQLGNNYEIAKQYYTIAAMHDDVPEAVRILAVMSNDHKDDPKSTAIKFTLLGVNGFDKEPYQCHAIGEKIIATLDAPTITDADITVLETMEEQMYIPDENDTEMRGVNSCYEMMERALKYTYITYITEKSRQYPHATEASELQNIPLVPVPNMHKDMTLRKKDGVWNYSM